ncbi:MAG TPA: hypothetical protein VEC96_05705 [Anaerolineae bacterium]|nr:hypothetical protein [Anaerolineae bacterium]
MRYFLILGNIIFLIVIATACGREASTPDTVVKPTASPIIPAAIPLNSPFTLPVGQKAVLENETLTITFEEVRQDIRCPSSVECAEKGFARILIVVQSAGQSPVTYEMNTEPFYKADMGLGVNSIIHSAYNIQLTTLDPYPETIDQTMPLEDYRATFVVFKK